MNGNMTMMRAQRAGEFRKVVSFFPLLFVLLSLFLASCATIEHMRYTYDPLNLHAVRDEVMYRSAQPTGDDLRMVAEAYGIKSVINLRGAQPGKDWYDEELAVSRELGLEQIDIRMSAGRLPHREDLLSLLDAFNDLPRPILVHCRDGADRTGEAVAVFALDHLKWSKRKAAGQLHPYFGHFPDRYPAKTYFIREVYRGEGWARESYDPCRQDYKYYDKGVYCGTTAKPVSLRIDGERGMIPEGLRPSGRHVSAIKIGCRGDIEGTSFNSSPAWQARPRPMG